MAADLLGVADLRVDIPVRSVAVRASGGVSLALAPGDTLDVVADVVAGESGSGKTMVAMPAKQLLAPAASTTGRTIEALGTDVYEQSAHPCTAGLLEAVSVLDPTSRGARDPKVRAEPPMRPFAHAGHLATWHSPRVEPLLLDRRVGAQPAGAAAAGASTAGASTADPSGSLSATGAGF